MNPSDRVAASIPTPSIIMSMGPLQSAQTLKILHDNAQHTLNSLFDNAHQNAFEFLHEKISPHHQGFHLEDIYYFHQKDSPNTSPTAREENLKSIFEHIYIFGHLSGLEVSNSVFYTKNNHTFEQLPSASQTLIKNALLELQGIAYYLMEIDKFWEARHEHTSLTNKEYMAQLFASQLHCANVLRITDRSFTLTSGLLVSRLSNIDRLSDAYLYRPSFVDEHRSINIPLTGAFVISRHPEDQAGQENNCVLYLPDTSMQQFDSLTAMKVHLAGESYTHALDRISACLSQKQHLQLKNLGNHVLAENHVALTAVAFNRDFYSEQIQLLINKQKEDLIYNWSRLPEQPETTRRTHFLRQAIDTRPFDFFGACVKTHAIPLLNIWEAEHLPKQKMEKAKQPTLLKPIKITVFIHKDLMHQKTSSLYDHYFSWLKTELEGLTKRTINIQMVESAAYPTLTNFDYKQDHGRQVINAWKTRVITDFEKNSITYSDLDKFILLTQDTLRTNTFGSIYGIADALKGNFAIAAISKYRTAAHEVGHLLGATHEDGEIVYNGWWHESLMEPRDRWSFLRGNVYRFSDKNRENIKNYLDKRP